MSSWEEWITSDDGEKKGVTDTSQNRPPVVDGSGNDTGGDVGDMYWEAVVLSGSQSVLRNITDNGINTLILRDDVTVQNNLSVNTRIYTPNINLNTVPLLDASGNIDSSFLPEAVTQGASYWRVVDNIMINENGHPSANQFIRIYDTGIVLCNQIYIKNNGAIGKVSYPPFQSGPIPLVPFSPFLPTPTINADGTVPWSMISDKPSIPTVSDVDAALALASLALALSALNSAFPSFGDTAKKFFQDLFNWGNNGSGGGTNTGDNDNGGGDGHIGWRMLWRKPIYVTDAGSTAIKNHLYLNETKDILLLATDKYSTDNQENMKASFSPITNGNLYTGSTRTLNANLDLGTTFSVTADQWKFKSDGVYYGSRRIIYRTNDGRFVYDTNGAIDEATGSGTTEGSTSTSNRSRSGQPPRPPPNTVSRSEIQEEVREERIQRNRFAQNIDNVTNKIDDALTATEERLERAWQGVGNFFKRTNKATADVLTQPPAKTTKSIGSSFKSALSSTRTNTQNFQMGLALRRSTAKPVFSNLFSGQ